MKKIELVIKISEHNKNVIDRFVNGEGFEVLPTPIVDDVIRAVWLGQPLPKEHGRLIDVSNLLTVTEINSDGSEHTYVPYSEIEEAQTIIGSR